MGSEEYARHGLRVSTAHVLDNVGFTSASDEAVDVLTDVLRRVMTKIIESSKMYAEHAGRNQLIGNDIGLAFRRMNYSSIELAEYISQTGNVGNVKPLPQFPASPPKPRIMFHPPPSERELQARPEHIPRFIQASHPEWTREGADYLAVMKPSTSNDRKGVAPDFPSFIGLSARELGMCKIAKKSTQSASAKKDDSSATGIRSSANIYSQKLADQQEVINSFTKKKHKFHTISRGHSHSPTPSNPLFLRRSESSSRADSPSTSSQDDRSKLKTRSSNPLAFATDGGSSPMPTLRDETQSPGLSDIPRTPRGSDDPMDSSFDTSIATPPYADEHLLASNNLLFQRLKDEAEKDRQKKMEKDRKNEQKIRKREENKEKKKEQLRRKEERKKEQEQVKAKKEADRKQKEKEKEEARQAEQRRREEAMRIAEELRIAAEEARRKREAEEEALRREFEEKELARQRAEEERRLAELARYKEELRHENKPLKIVISNPLDSSSASSVFSPSPVRSPVPKPITADDIFITGDDSTTTPCMDASAMIVGAETTFPMDLSMTSTNSEEIPTKHKKKNKKKDKDRNRERSRSPHKKDKKKEKEHKKKKKKDKDRDRAKDREKNRDEKKLSHKHRDHKEKKHHHNDKVKEKASKPDQPVPQPPPEQKIMLKIRLGDQTPQQEPVLSPKLETPVKLKLNQITPEKDKTVPPLRIGMSLSKETKPSPEEPKKSKLMTKAELKAPASVFTEEQKAKEEKRKRKEEKRRREEERRKEEEREQKKKEEEERKKKEEERKRKEEEQARQEKERQRREKEEKAREEEEKKALERERQKKLGTPPPVALHIEIDSTKKKKKHKDKDRERREDKPRKKEPSPPGPKADADDNDEPEVWICPACSVAWTEGATMVCCDMCDNWFHWHCVGLLVAPDEHVPWFCQKCSSKRKRSFGKSSSSSMPPAKKKKHK